MDKDVDAPTIARLPVRGRAATEDETAANVAATSSPGADGFSKSPDELLDAGKALRRQLARKQQGVWKKSATRANPIDLLKASDEGRIPELAPIRYGRMLASPFAFYRGTAGIMAADLAAAPVTGVRVQACGDCHLMNFGGFATPERNIIFDINDFDETLPAPWEWDVKRLVASFVLAARSLGLSDDKAREAAETCARSYRKRLADYGDQHPLANWYAQITSDDVIELMPKAARPRIEARIEAALERTGSEVDFPKLAGMVGGRLSIRDAPPLIFHPDMTRDPEFRTVLPKVLAAYRETLSDDRRALLDRYQPVDVAMKVVGVGSVGRRCWIGLLMSASNEPLFLQFKEAVASVLEPFAGASVYPHHGQRVVMGQRLMQPASDLFLGWFVGPANIHFYARQLRDAKIKPIIETWDAETLTVFAKACGWVLARAHAKSGEPALISGYLGRSDEFDEAMGRFGLAYADQAERDYAALKTAVRNGVIDAYEEG
jgi:uncharacterized protein (DUF2252 family)